MKRPNVLNARFVDTVKRCGRYGDGRGGNGLFLNVKPTANGRLSKSWVQRIRVANQITHIGLGGYPIVTLAEARKKAVTNRRIIAKGRDPRSVGIPTFRDGLEKVLDLQRPNWRSPKSEEQWRSSLEAYASELMHKRVSKIQSGDVMDVLRPIWNTKRETARRVRQRIAAVMKWAIAQGYRPDNPAGEQVLQALPRNGVKRKHQPALPHGRVGWALERIRATDAWPSTKLAFELLVLTATRSGEVRLASWEEMDIEEGVWTIPGERMKANREHRVPLSDSALNVLREAAEFSSGRKLVFPSPRGKSLSNATLSKLCRDNAIGAVPHGFRSSFRDWCGETGQPRDVAEQALAHVIKNKAEAAYARSDLFDRRRNLMEAWAQYISEGYRHRGSE